ncbi:MAG: response regulator transcription factor [Candidatus Nanopelagicales bacterium]
MSAPNQRVMVADYQPLVARGLVATLAADPGIDVFESSADPVALVADALEWAPELVLLGVPRNSASVMRAAGELSQQVPGVCLIVITDTDRELDVVTMVKVGVTGVLARGAPIADVLMTVKQGLLGRSTLSGDVANRLLTQVAAASRLSGPMPAGALTARELEVLRLVADGMHNRDVANQLHISENTVKNHMRSVHEKLGVRTRTEAVVTAARQGLLGLG